MAKQLRFKTVHLGARIAQVRSSEAWAPSAGVPPGTSSIGNRGSGGLDKRGGVPK